MHTRGREHGLCLLSVLAAVLTVGFATQPTVASRVIGDELHVHVPLAPCELGLILFRIARLTGVPSGMEHLPGKCPPPTFGMIVQPDASRKSHRLTGKTVSEAMDYLVSLRPEFAWSESDGVVVLRPAHAWEDPRHFLHQIIEFEATDEHLGGVSQALRAAVFGEPRRANRFDASVMRTEEGNRRFSVNLGTPQSALAVLEAVARQHGALYWEVKYCRAPATVNHAALWLWTLEDDPTGVGVSSPARFRRVQGKSLDACAE